MELESHPDSLREPPVPRGQWRIMAAGRGSPIGVLPTELLSTPRSRLGIPSVLFELPGSIPRPGPWLYAALRATAETDVSVCVAALRARLHDDRLPFRPLLPEGREPVRRLVPVFGFRSPARYAL
jgi:hypothetical protein